MQGLLHVNVYLDQTYERSIDFLTTGKTYLFLADLSLRFKRLYQTLDCHNNFLVNIYGSRAVLA